MSEKLWIMIVILGLLILLGGVFLVISLTNKKKRKVDYYSLFVMGIIWFPLGIVFENSLFFILGLLFMVTGLANKDKWEKNSVTWNQLTKKEKIARIIIIGVLILLVILGVVLFFTLNSS